MTVTKLERRTLSRQFRNNPRDNLVIDFGSIGWAIRTGKESATTIRSIRAGGYDKARQFYAFYSDGRWQHGAALRAVSAVKTLGNPRPYYIKDVAGKKGIFALSALDSLHAKKPVYHYMR